MLLLLLILIPVLWIVYKEQFYARKRRKIAHTQGPKMLPFIGNAHQLGKTPHDILNFMFDNFYKYNHHNFRVWIGYYLNIFVTEPQDVEFILSSSSLIKKSDIYEMTFDWLGDGLLTGSGPKWHKHRKIITPAFHFKILQDFHEVMNKTSNKFMEKLREASKGDNIFDFQNMVNYFTLDVICDTAMGVSINAMDNPHTEFAKAVEYICANINMRAFHPLKRSKLTYQFFPEYQDYCKAVKTLKDFTFDVIEKRIKLHRAQEENKTLDSGHDEFSKPRRAFLDTLLSARVDDRPFTTQELYEEVSTFIFAGHDTTSSAISFVIYLLSRHLAVQAKVFEEQQRIMGEHMKRDATFQEIADMKYLDMVLKETLRLYPSVPMVGRHTEKEYNMNGKLIPEDTSLNIFIMSLGYNEHNFPDPYRFDPERFADGTEAHKPFELVPFSAGLRNCIGQKFAQLEIKTVISKIIRNFQILPAIDELASKDGYVSNILGPLREEQRPKLHKYEPKLEMVLTLKSENGIMVRMRERN
ncbi:cytochrome P450 4e2 [Musca domestica]|uniref:Cytochrome P450 4e2 n=1 Tax=Musca domestica TaxID=7370 RepID=A0A9J7I4U8_MUSDO|nr:cytochrome P450 4e2 [Musca domestica]